MFFVVVVVELLSLRCLHNNITRKTTESVISTLNSICASLFLLFATITFDKKTQTFSDLGRLKKVC